MALLKNSAVIHKGLFFNSPVSSNQMALQCPRCFPVYYCRRRNYYPQARAEASPSTEQVCFLERPRRRQALSLGAMVAFVSLSQASPISFAAEVKKGFQLVSDRKDGYSFLYPFGWQEVVVQGQDKVFKDVIEPLESVSINMVPTSKQDVRELGSPQEVADALIKRVLAPPSQKIKLVEASEHDADGKAYYTFEFTAQAPNFTRHALGAIVIANENVQNFMHLHVDHVARQTRPDPLGRNFCLQLGPSPVKRREKQNPCLIEARWWNTEENVCVAVHFDTEVNFHTG